MADYYNTTRGPLSVTLHDGSSLAVPPKSWVFIEPGNESSASIVRLVQKGYLVRAPFSRTFEAAPAPVPAPVPGSEPAPAPAPAPASDAPSAPKQDGSTAVLPTLAFSSASTSSVKEEIHRKKR